MGDVHTSQETHCVSTTEPITILVIIHRPVFYLKHTMGDVHTSQETHYVSTTEPITILVIINRSVFYLKHDISETGFCFRVQMEPTEEALASSNN
jgi:hypothetical protein